MIRAQVPAFGADLIVFFKPAIKKKVQQKIIASIGAVVHEDSIGGMWIKPRFPTLDSIKKLKSSRFVLTVASIQRGFDTYTVMADLKIDFIPGTKEQEMQKVISSVGCMVYHVAGSGDAEANVTRGTADDAIPILKSYKAVHQVEKFSPFFLF
jgi:hypothetical protein